MLTTTPVPDTTIQQNRPSISKILTIAALTFAMLFAPGLVPQAEAASLDLHFGGGFRIGGVFFNIGVHSREGRYQDHYYRTADRLAYRGYSCSRACYRRGDHMYHHRSCPVVERHFDRYGYQPFDVFDAYAPRYEGRARYDRYDRGQRYERHDRHDRYERRDRYQRRHGHDRRGRLHYHRGQRCYQRH